MSDLTQIPAAELVADLKKHRNATDLGIQLAMIDVRAELDRRCTDAGIHLNGNGTFKAEPRDNMKREEAKEWLALMDYTVSKIKTSDERRN
jgi:hypothetical protein